MLFCFICCHLSHTPRPNPVALAVAAPSQLLAAQLRCAAAVVEVFSEWAGPCKSILPTIKKLRLEGKDEE